MFRVLQNSLIENTERIFGSNSQCLQFCRWKRKPRWMPTAKSKLFRIPERKVQPLGESEELLRLHNHYRLQLRSVRLFLREELKRIKETSTVDHLIITPEEEETELQRCISENDAWNMKIAEERKIRVQKEFEERKNISLERIRLAEERKQERFEEIEEIVRKEKERAKHIITKEKLDVAIEHALANPVDYNFALDIHGRLYMGREAKTPTATESSDSEKIESISSS